jgi:hypothetical protein
MTQLPVPVAPTPVFDARRRAIFCDHLALTGNVRLACRAAGVSPPTAYKARRGDYDFAIAWNAALLLARDHAEQVLAERALEGVEEEVFYHGEPVAMRRRYDSRLLLAHLSRLDRMVEEGGDACDVAQDFDAALERLGRGEEVLPEEEPDEIEPLDVWAARDEDLPPLEIALRWLEAQGKTFEDEDE